jgi:fumarylacetoacetase
VDDAFGHHELPFGVFSVPGHLDEPRVGVAVGRQILDLAALFGDDVFRQPVLNPFMAQGPPAWAATRRRIGELLDDHVSRVGVTDALVPAAGAQLHLPFEVADFVDFNSSLQHATNAGLILRPGTPPVRDNWRRMPVGYHARTGTVVVSGTPVVRPCGQFVDDGEIVFAPTRKLDVEAEVGFVVGTASRRGFGVATGEFDEHVFGVVLVLDWSARDIQALETVPLGPFLGKSFATTISPWVVPIEALAGARRPAPEQTPKPAKYLEVETPAAFDIRLELSINNSPVSTPSFASMYWTPPQQLAHLTANGAHVRTGDLFASGTVSDEVEFGSLLELSWDGAKPVRLADGGVRGYLADGDEVRLRATAHGTDGSSWYLGSAAGVVTPARHPGDSIGEPVG